MSPLLTADDYVTGIRSGNRQVLSKAITLIESTRAEHQQLARAVVQACLPFSGNSFRVGITGAPGVGKSTFIDALGMLSIEAGKRVAVLAIDPSSQKTAGSILGDKTRMARLSATDQSFIRPSPNSGTLGGIASSTRESMILCEAAGYDLIFIETVGVGQSEFSVHQMVDMLILLLITGAGDDLQGIKRGIMEMADLIVVNKADGPNDAAARQLLRMIRQAAHVLPAPRPNWSSQVVAASSVEGTGIEQVMDIMSDFERLMRTSSALSINRSKQAVAWMHQHIEEGLKRQLMNHPGAASRMQTLAQSVAEGAISPVEAAEQVLGLFEKY